MTPTERPPAPLAAAIVVSDATAQAVLGLSARQFRAFVRKYGVPHTKLGRRTVARVDRVLEVVDRLSGAGPRPAWNEDAIVELAARGGRR